MKTHDELLDKLRAYPSHKPFSLAFAEMLLEQIRQRDAVIRWKQKNFGIDIQCFIEVLIRVMTPEQIETLLQRFSEADDNGHCAMCGEPDVPVDDQGITLSGEDLEHAVEWQERHKDDCPVHLLELLKPSPSMS